MSLRHQSEQTDPDDGLVSQLETVLPLNEADEGLTEKPVTC